MRNTGLHEAQTESRLPGEISTTSDMHMIPSLYKEELKSLLMKEESENVSWKLNIQKTKIMASSSITSWQPMRKQWKQWQTLFSWTPKSLQMVTTALKWNHLLLRRKAMTNLDSILKSRDINLPTKVCIVKAMVFPVVMYGYESWTIKKAEHRRIDASELWCWRRLLRVPWTARRSNQSILKEISTGYS